MTDPEPFTEVDEHMRIILQSALQVEAARDYVFALPTSVELVVDSKTEEPACSILYMNTQTHIIGKLLNL